jgi:hypothetical protein
MILMVMRACSPGMKGKDFVLRWASIDSSLMSALGFLSSLDRLSFLPAWM